MKPSLIVFEKSAEIKQIVANNNALNPRVFGSIARGEDNSDSDIDLIIDPIAEKTTFLDIENIQEQVALLTGFDVDVVTPMGIKKSMLEKILLEATPL